MKTNIILMKGLFLGLSILAVIGFSECNKKAGPLKACFTFSKNTAKVNDTVYLLNCSENYSKFKWIIPGAFTFDSINKHNYFVPTTIGNQSVYLLTWSLDGTDTTGVAKILTVK